MALVEVHRKDAPSLWAEVDEADLAVLSKHRWYPEHGRFTTYAQTMIRKPDGQRTSIRMHTLLTGYGLCDHVNRNGLDNRRANLREATTSQNGANRVSSKGSPFKGVCWDKTNLKWKAYITVEGTRISLGYHTTAERAAHAYDIKAAEVFGDFALLNF